MTLSIELTPVEEARLTAAAQERGLPPAELAREILTEHLPPLPQNGEQNPTLALFAQWAKEDARMTPEEIEQERLWEDFEAGIDETRRASGMREPRPPIWS